MGLLVALRAQSFVRCACVEVADGIVSVESGSECTDVGDGARAEELIVENGRERRTAEAEARVETRRAVKELQGERYKITWE